MINYYNNESQYFGVYRPSTGYIYIDLNRNMQWNGAVIDYSRATGILNATPAYSLTLPIHNSNPVITSDNCMVYNSSNQNILTGITNITFDSEFYDTNNMHNTINSNQRINISKSGIYLISGGFEFQSTPNPLNVDILKNGLPIVSSRYSAGRSVNLFTTSYCNEGDYIYMTIYSTTNNTIKRIDNSSPILSVTELNGGTANITISSTSSTYDLNSTTNNLANPFRFEPYLLLSLIFLIVGILTVRGINILGFFSGLIALTFFVLSYPILSGTILDLVFGLIVSLIIANGLSFGLKGDKK